MQQIELNILHSTLISILLLPDQYHRAIERFECHHNDNDPTAVPLQCTVLFTVKNKKLFTSLIKRALTYPQDREQWEQFIMTGYPDMIYDKK